MLAELMTTLAPNNRELTSVWHALLTVKTPQQRVCVCVCVWEGDCGKEEHVRAGMFFHFVLCLLMCVCVRSCLCVQLSTGRALRSRPWSCVCVCVAPSPARPADSLPLSSAVDWHALASSCCGNDRTLIQRALGGGEGLVE